MSQIISGAAYLAVSLQVANKWRKKNVRIAVVGFMVIGVVVAAWPDLGIAGIQSIGYSMTRVPGPWYWVLQLIIPGFWIGGFVVLVYAAKKGVGWVSKRKATALLIGSLPVVASLVGVIVLMQLGLEINATVFVSLTINVLLGVLIYTEYESGVFRFLSFIPSTQEYKLTYSAAQAAYSVASHGLSRAMVEFERALVVDALTKSGGNKSAAAELLGISRTTLRRKLGHKEDQG